jgi:hypothetical protein
MMLTSKELKDSLVSFSTAELLELNDIVVALLKARRVLDNVNSLAHLSVNDRCYFINKGIKIVGTIIEIKRGKVKFAQDPKVVGGYKLMWRVSPASLIKL